MKLSDGQSEFLWVFNFAILGYSRNSRKLDACEKLLFYSIKCIVCLYNVCMQLIKEGKRYEDLTEVAKLFNLYGADQVDTPGETENTDGQAVAA